MSLDVTWARRWIELAAADVAQQRDYLVDLDRAIGDGDHGENMDRGFKAALEALGQAQPASVAEVLKTVAKTLMSTVGGAAGPLYGTAFLRASKAAGDGDLDGAGVAAVIAGALDGIQARGKATTGEKTMVDARPPSPVAILPPSSRPPPRQLRLERPRRNPCGPRRDAPPTWANAPSATLTRVPCPPPSSCAPPCVQRARLARHERARFLRHRLPLGISCRRSL